MSTYKRRAMARMIRYTGQSLAGEIRQLSRLQTRGGGSVSLTVAAPAAEDATSLQITGDRLSGSVPPLLELTIDGHASTYVVQSEAEVDVSDNTLTVTISPGLDSAVSGGEAVTIDSYAATDHWVVEVEMRDEAIVAGLRGKMRHWHATPQTAADAITPRAGDALVVGTEKETIRRATRYASDGTAGAWSIWVGEAA